VDWRGSESTSHSTAVELETTDGERISLGKLAGMQSALKPVLHVTTFQIAAFRNDPRQDSHVFSPGFRFGGNMDIVYSCSATTTDFLDVGDQYLAIMGSISTLLRNRSLIVMRKTDAVWERVATYPHHNSPLLQTHSAGKTITLG
jgi:hypothetical protein